MPPRSEAPDGTSAVVWSWSPVTLFGARLRIHASFALVVLWSAVAWALETGSWARGGSFGAALMVVLFGSVVVHELAHCWQARALGMHVRDVIVLPIGGLARVEMRDEPAQAGPAANLALAALIACGALLASVPLPRSAYPFLVELHGADWWGLLVYALAANLALGIVNLVPIPPLDGGRVLRALVALSRDHAQAPPGGRTGRLPAGASAHARRDLAIHRARGRTVRLRAGAGAIVGLLSANAAAAFVAVLPAARPVFRGWRPPAPRSVRGRDGPDRAA